MIILLKACLYYYLILCCMSNIFPLTSFADHPTILRVDDRQRLARERREEREKQLGKAYSGLGFFAGGGERCLSFVVVDGFFCFLGVFCLFCFGVRDFCLFVWDLLCVFFVGFGLFGFCLFFNELSSASSVFPSACRGINHSYTCHLPITLLL